MSSILPKPINHTFNQHPTEIERYRLYTDAITRLTYYSLWIDASRS